MPGDRVNNGDTTTTANPRQDHNNAASAGPESDFSSPQQQDAPLHEDHATHSDDHQIVEVDKVVRFEDVEVGHVYDVLDSTHRWCEAEVKRNC